MIAAKELEANMCLTKQKDILPTKVVFVWILLKQHFIVLVSFAVMLAK